MDTAIVEKSLVRKESDIIKMVDAACSSVMQLKEPQNIAFIETLSNLLIETFSSNRKVLIAGNGGSLADSIHFAEELTGFFSKKRRKALPVIALSDSAHITCTANDYGYEWIFARGIEAYGQKGDLFIALTTSGNSPNVIRAVEKAQELGLITITLLGGSGGKLKGVGDRELVIRGSTSDRIQEAHMAALHMVIELVEDGLFGKDEHCSLKLTYPESS